MLNFLLGNVSLHDYKRAMKFYETVESNGNKHVANYWKPPPHSEKYIPAFELEHTPDSVVRTVHEEPYSNNVVVHYQFMHSLEPSTAKDKDWLRPRMLDRYFARERRMKH